ncbi:hypothetical protein HD597_009285 [Nonomuraea thailandensis]|uniref:DUF4367 domain-containing protein n=1 Tax=Nonomuraea thailandensis TaxID=1188745 RepID=A0A9X2GQR7_9ACTN|nr:hypothetical protein [Nonomuraea thailandensis]MCP2362265.1 hypothetical protein [Nonomuraea thailandensis]
MSSREHPDEPFDDIEAELTALGNLLDVPGPPPPSELAAAVRARLEQPAEAPADSHDAVRARPDQPVQPSDDPHHAGGPDPAHGPVTGPVRPPGRRDSRAPARRRRRARWAIVAAVVVVVITVTAATPQGRAAVTQILRLAGIEIEVGPTAPPPVTTTATLPGEHQVPPSDVPGRARFQVRAPAALGDPQRVTVADDGRLVSMFWPGGIRLDQFDGTVSPFFFKKLGPPSPEYTRVNGREAWWIPGEHPLGYLTREDGTRIPLRQAAATLIWQQDGLNHRLEGAKSMEEAVRIASSLE